ncbi:hypothetical membrane protein [Corynebacterium kutscheri]|uniref:DUF2029 domain-containing protein n=1 Tax=Corynebacterium kutscheri TaxID=35755 RepID=A0A0F6QXZ6_9CORY|nr:glycosyltransferase 87 family protein [Corynebacterium kutscheri]AKE40292.1 Protein of unknown function (DUF2029) [Corynebacterium kutscheri]VEH10684.1 hypothetical membrane protein [Corynebacterium kutscheri]VEH81395.1 hypothetical membrane protein [Corynebacterium kutscheri]
MYIPDAVLPYTRRISWCAFLATLIIASYWFIINNGSLGWYYHIDADVYYEGGKAFLLGKPLYTQRFSVNGFSLPFTYPPLAAMLFAPMAITNTVVSAMALTAVSIILLWWVAVQMLRATGTDSPKLLALWLMPILLLFEPVRQTLSFGQINIMLMALVIADTIAPRPSWARPFQGALIGLAAAIKLTPAVFVLFFLFRCQWKACAATIVSFLFYTTIAAVIRWEDSYLYWTSTISDPNRIGGLIYSGNQSLRGMLVRLIGADTAQSVWLPLAALIGLIIALAMWRMRTHAPELVVLNSLVALLCSPVSWSHHWVWLVPLTIVAASYCWWWAAIVGFISLASTHWLLSPARNAATAWHSWQHIVGNSYVLLSFLVLAVAIVWPPVRSHTRLSTSQVHRI